MSGNLNAIRLKARHGRPIARPMPFDAGIPVVAIGDSILGFGVYGTDSASGTVTGLDISGSGPIEWCSWLDPRFVFNTWLDLNAPYGTTWTGSSGLVNCAGGNAGIPGDHLQPISGVYPGIIPRLKTVLAYQPSIVILEGGTNTINSGDGAYGSGYPYICQQLLAGVYEVLATGAQCILWTLTMRGDWPQGDARYTTLLQVNAWIRTLSIPGLTVFDAYQFGVDTSGNQILSMFQSDFIHPNMMAAWRYASGNALSNSAAYANGTPGLLSILQGMISSGSVFDQNSNINNLMPALTGTTGTNGTGSSGAVATGWEVAMEQTPGSTVVCSKGTNAAGYPTQILTITPVNTAASYHRLEIYNQGFFSSVPAFANTKAGAWVQFWVNIGISNTSSITGVRATCQVRNIGTIRVQSIVGDLASGQWPLPYVGCPNADYWMISAPIQIPAGVTFDRVYMTIEIEFPPSVTDTPVVTIAQPIARVVPDPRPAYRVAT